MGPLHRAGTAAGHPGASVLQVPSGEAGRAGLVRNQDQLFQIGQGKIPQDIEDTVLAENAGKNLVGTGILEGIEGTPAGKGKVVEGMKETGAQVVEEICQVQASSGWKSRLLNRTQYFGNFPLLVPKLRLVVQPVRVWLIHYPR